MPKWIDRDWRPADEDLGNLSRKDQRPGRYRAFVPDELCGRTLEVGESARDAAESALQALTRADERVGERAGFLHHLLLRSEAISSSYIEGVKVSPQRLAVAETLGRGDAKARAVIGNVQAVERAIETLGDRAHTITVADLEGLQRIVAPNVAHGVRREQNWIGGPGYSPLRAAFVPPPEDEVPGLLTDLVSYLNATGGNPIVRAAVAHAQFETIHPFADGNGRVGRALIHTVLRRADAVRHILVPVSTVFAAQTDAYLAGLTSFRSDPQQLDPWVTGFSEALTLAAGNAVRLADNVTSLDAQIAEQLIRWRSGQGITPAKPRQGSVILNVLDHLAQEPVITAQRVETRYGVSRPAASRALAQLHEAGVLKRVKDQHGNTTAYVSGQHLALVALIERSNLAAGQDTSVRRPRRAPAAPAHTLAGLDPKSVAQQQVGLNGDQHLHF